ncbi:MAG: DNA double-strand break repair nuclease NurA [Candidatus Bipolaricaulia bacterium]
MFQTQVQEITIRKRTKDYGREAHRRFHRLNLSAGVSAYTDPECLRSPILELASWTATESGVVYGLDGGSTRPMHFRNGMTICANQAVLSSDSTIQFDGLPLEAFRTVSLATHSFDPEDRDLSSYYTGDLVDLWRIHIPREYLRRKVDPVVKGLADAASEARHLLRMTDRLRLGPEDLVFLDGGIYPIGLYYYLVDDARWAWDIGIGSWEHGTEILQQYVEIAERYAELGTPYVGINKTPSTRYLIKFCLEDSTWANDRQFIAALFDEIPADNLGYTGWFVQVKYPSRGVSGAQGFELFSQLSNFRKRLAPDVYHVCYFFVYDPRVESVLKVETPYTILQNQDPDRLRLQVLSEIARGKGVPNVIRVADSQARVTQVEREALIRSSGMLPDTLYNQSRGEPL